MMGGPIISIRASGLVASGRHLLDNAKTNSLIWRQQTPFNSTGGFASQKWTGAPMPCVLSWPMPTLKDTVYHSNGHHALYAWLKGAQPAYMRLIRRHLQPSVKGSLRVRRAGSRDLSGLNQARACSVPVKGSLAAASPPLTADLPCPKL